MKIKEFFDNEFKHVKFDKALYKRIRLYRVSFLTQTKDHVSFFGGSLLGTNIVRFKSNYVRQFFMDIINIEPTDVANKLHDVPAINPNFKISGDVFNLCLWYMAHRFLTSNKFNDKAGMAAAKECVLIFNYRTIAALISKRFRFLANIEIAIATHESLSNKFILKQKNSWVNYLEYRADKILEKKAPYHKNLLTLKDEPLFINTINEGNNAIRSSFNIIYNRYIEIRESGTYVKADSIIDTMNEEEVGDISDRLTNDIRRVLADVLVPNTFYNKDILTIVQPIVPDYAAANLHYYIKGLSQLANTSKRTTRVMKFISDTLTFCYDRIAKTEMTSRERSSPATLIHVAKGALYATRVVDKRLLDLKVEGEYMVDLISHIKSSQRKTAIKHALLLYIVIYSFTLR